jgi:hypothetical protein
MMVSGRGKVVSFCESGSELTIFIKCGEFVDSLRKDYLLKDYKK